MNPETEQQKRLRGERRQAIELLKAVLYDSVIENEHDEDIHNFLVEAGENNPDFEPYWV